MMDGFVRMEEVGEGGGCWKDWGLMCKELVGVSMAICGTVLVYLSTLYQQYQHRVQQVTHVYS
jgi:hypothetical protein